MTIELGGLAENMLRLTELNKIVENVLKESANNHRVYWALEACGDNYLIVEIEASDRTEMLCKRVWARLKKRGWKYYEIEVRAWALDIAETEEQN